MIPVFEIVLFALFGIFVINILIVWGAKELLRRRFLANIRKSGHVCLTFDDGPSPASTPEILRLLGQEGIKATFFLTGENVEKYPDLASRIADEGHEIGQHGHWHIHPWKCWPLHSLMDLVKGAHTIRQQVCYEKPMLLRPPYGKLNLITLSYVLLSRRQLAFWDIDPKDYASQSGDAIVKHVMDRIFTHTTILLHDGRDSSDASANVTVSAVRAILMETKNRGMAFATVSEALRVGQQEKPGRAEGRA